MTAALEAHRPIYLLGSIKVPKAELRPADMEFLGAWHRIASEVAHDPTRLAKTMLVALRAHPTFASVGRVCVARWIAGTHALEVMSSANGVGVGPNTMTPGYRCFVGARSSLFELHEGRVRIYGDTQPVLGAFKRDGKPVQRSIGRIHGMGLRSGVCTPLSVAGTPRGLFFVNSTEPHAFSNLGERDAAVLALATNAAKAALLSSLEPFPPRERAEAEPLDVQTLSDMLGARSHGRFSIDAPSLDLGACLVTPVNVVDALLALLEAGQATEATTIAIGRADETLRIVIDRLVLPEIVEPMCRGFMRSLGFALVREADGVALEIPFDQVSGGVNYSV